MPARRDTWRYILVNNRGREIYHGITNDPERRASEHVQSGRIADESQLQIQGPAVTRKSALAWERNHNR